MTATDLVIARARGGALRRRRRGSAAIAVSAIALVAAACGDDHAGPQLANPASEYCVARGGTVDIVDGAEGQVGFCELPDGRRVEEWQLYRERTTTTVATAPPTPAPTETTAPMGRCSGGGGGGPALTPDRSLPPVVDAMRREITAAAATCDYSALAALVDRNGKAIRYTFGMPGDPIAAWRDEEASGKAVPPMRALRLLLGLRAGRSTGPDGTTYVWPAAFAVDHPSDDDLREVAATGLYSIEQLRAWVASGTNYLGYRVFITSGGDWTLFVEGD